MIEDIKERLLKQPKLIFNEPHFTNQLLLREGSKQEVVKHLTQPEALYHVNVQTGSLGDTKYVLSFATDDNKTILLPVIFTNKGLYILTCIKRHRRTR